MSALPQYVGVPKSASVAISTANTNRDGVTGVYGTLHTAGASGSRFDRVRVNATGTTTAGMVRFFVGTALVYELPVMAVTPSTTTPAWGVDVDFEKGLTLGAGIVLKVSTDKAEAFAVTTISGGDF